MLPGVIGLLHCGGPAGLIYPSTRHRLAFCSRAVRSRGHIRYRGLESSLHSRLVSCRLPTRLPVPFVLLVDGGAS
jgi:hypothetical protein